MDSNLYLKLFSDKFKREMTLRWIFYFFFAISLSLGMWYYVLIFCGIYSSSSYSWMVGSFISLSIDYVLVSSIIPLSLSVVRLLITKWPSLM